MPDLKPALSREINRSHMLARGLRGYWLANEGSGRHVGDVSPNRSNGTLNGTGDHWVASRFGHALAFNGTDDYVSIPNFGVHGSGWTLSLHFRFTATPVSNNARVCDFPYDASNSLFRIQERTDGTVRVVFRDSGGINRGANTDTVLTVGQWYHVVVQTFAAEVAIFVDGALDKTISFAPTLTTNVDAAASLGGDGSTFVSCEIDDVRVWELGLLEKLPPFLKTVPILGRLSSDKWALFRRSSPALFVSGVESGINTNNKKLAIMEMDQIYEPGLPISPGTLGEDDKRQMLWGYPFTITAADQSHFMLLLGVG